MESKIKQENDVVIVEIMLDNEKYIFTLSHINHNEFLRIRSLLNDKYVLTLGNKLYDLNKNEMCQTFYEANVDNIIALGDHINNLLEEHMK